MSAACELTILMPCLNEAETLATCIRKAKGFLERRSIDGEVLIADNGSTDASRDIAASFGARVVSVAERGYGAALMGGIRAARGRSIIMGDADDSYDFSRLDAFVERLRAGDELVMGNRFRGGIAPGAMPPLHRYLGNPVLTGIGRLFFHSNSKDFHCGLRGFDKRAIDRLELQTTGMEFASEMPANQGLGRIVRDSAGHFDRIVEERDATDDQKRIREINTGCYAFDSQSLLSALDRIRPDNNQAEYYLTDCPLVLKRDGKTVVAANVFEVAEAMGVNTRAQLADVTRAIQQTTQARLMASGVSIVAPELTYIDPRAVIGADTVILPFTHIQGPANIGADCRIGPHAVLEGAVTIPDGTRVKPFQYLQS